MPENYEDNPRSIKFYVKRFIRQNTQRLQGKKVIDFPAGNGITSRILKENGAVPFAFDLFPEYFKVEGVHCVRASVEEGLPVDDGFADVLICQEGIEHFPDQLHAFYEFNRVLKKGGTLLVTTPNYSNLRSKVSYLLTESERFGSIMPPNEIDSIWMSQQKAVEELFYGHIFLIGIQKLRLFARLSGFKIHRIHFTRAKTTSVLLLPFLYPFILFFSWLTYLKNKRKITDDPDEMKQKTYKEVFRLSINPKILIDGHLMIEFEKESSPEEIRKMLKSKYKEFGLT